MAKCKECLECVKMIGKEKIVFFCDIDNDISDHKLEENHECDKFKPDETDIVLDKHINADQTKLL